MVNFDGVPAGNMVVFAVLHLRVRLAWMVPTSAGPVKDRWCDDTLIEVVGWRRCSPLLRTCG